MLENHESYSYMNNINSEQYFRFIMLFWKISVIMSSFYNHLFLAEIIANWSVAFYTQSFLLLNSFHLTLFSSLPLLGCGFYHHTPLPLLQWFKSVLMCGLTCFFVRRCFDNLEISLGCLHLKSWLLTVEPCTIQYSS